MRLSLSLKLLGIAFLAFVSYYVWYVHYDYRFEEISPNKVYKSALIPPSEISNYLQKNNIKTVINLLDPGAQLYSAVYRMEYENWSNQDARAQTRVVLAALGYKSSFALGKGKGDFLHNYIKRDEKEARLVKNSLAIEINKNGSALNE